MSDEKKQIRKKDVASKYLRLKMKGHPEKVRIRVAAHPDTGIYAEFKNPTDGQWVHITNRDEFESQIASAKERREFKHAFRDAGEKWQVHIGNQDIVVNLLYKARERRQRIHFRLVAPLGEFTLPVVIEYSIGEVGEWKRVESPVEQKFPPQVWQNIVQSMSKVGQQRAKALQRLHPQFQYIPLDKDHKLGVYLDESGEHCVWSSMNPYGGFQEIKDIGAFQRDHPSLDTKPIELAQKRCLQAIVYRYRKTTNLTDPDIWQMVDESSKEFPDTFPKPNVNFPDHPYICPPQNDPKACFFDEKKKTCTRPPRGRTCRSVRDQMQNRTQNVSLLLDNWSLKPQKPGYIDSAHGGRNCGLFYASAKAARGPSLNYRRFMDEVRKRYSKRITHPILDPKNPPVLNVADLSVLFEEMDNVYFGGSLREGKFPTHAFGVLPIPQVRDMKECTNAEVMKAPHEYLALYLIKNNTIYVNLHELKKVWDVKCVQANKLQTDGRAVRSHFDLILNSLTHETAHWLTHIFECDHDGFGGHGPGWLALSKYFFGGGDQDAERYHDEVILID